MKGQTLKRLMRFFGRGCYHRFTWPRLGGNGQHYQICANCGAAYEYDWKGMRRKHRLLVTNPQHPMSLSQTRSSGPVH